MRKFEATTLDFYDDRGELLKELVTDAADIPDFVKTAEAVNPRTHPEMFALVMHEDGKMLKKFATVDAGNTWLSTLYFYQTRENLPLEAQKVASSRLIEACENFGIEIPDFLFDILGDDAGTITSNVVDVTNASPPMQKVAAVEREEIEYAIERADGSQYFPLKDAKSVKTAAEYFEGNHRNMVPRERREYAVKVANVAKRGELPLPTELRKYASQGYSPNLEGHLTTRYLHLVNADAPQTHKDLLVKVAALQRSTPPEEFAEVLERFDVEVGLDALWDRDIADPYYSTFCLEKVAKGAVAAPTRFDLGDNTFVTEQELLWLAERGKKQMIENFGWDVANSFTKNPVAIFKSMPTPEKKVIGKMAMNYSPIAGQ